MKEAEFIKKVRIVDEDAGQKLHTMIKEAKQSTEYAEKISFYYNAIVNSDLAYEVLIRLFKWKATPEGTWYWDDLFDELEKVNLQKDMNKHIKRVKS